MRAIDCLSPCKSVASMPRWKKDSLEFGRMVEDIRLHGVKHPITLIDNTDTVVDGWTRVLAAKAAGLTEVPVQFEPFEEQVTIILRELHRRHLTKGQMAWVAGPMLDEAVEASSAKRAANGFKPKNSKNPNVSHETNSVGFVGQKGPKTVTSLAAELGCSDELLRQAQKVRNLFSDYEGHEFTWPDGTIGNPEEYFRPRIEDLEDPMSLGEVIRGIAGKVEAEGISHPQRGAHGGGKPAEQSRQMQLFAQVVTTDFRNRWEYWRGANEEARADVLRKVRAEAAATKPSEAEDVAEFYANLAQIYKQRARGTDKK